MSCCKYSVIYAKMNMKFCLKWSHAVWDFWADCQVGGGTQNQSLCVVLSIPQLKDNVLEHRYCMNMVPRQKLGVTVLAWVGGGKSKKSFLVPMIKITLFGTFFWKFVCNLCLSYWLFRTFHFGTGKIHPPLEKQFKSSIWNTSKVFPPRGRRSRGFGDLCHL